MQCIKYSEYAFLFVCFVLFCFLFDCFVFVFVLFFVCLFLFSFCFFGHKSPHLYTLFLDLYEVYQDPGKRRVIQDSDMTICNSNSFLIHKILSILNVLLIYVLLYFSFVVSVQSAGTISHKKWNRAVLLIVKWKTSYEQI